MLELLRDIVSALSGDFRLMRQAPRSTTVVVIMALIVTGLVWRWYYMDVLDEKDRLIATYRERLGMSANAANKYSRLRNRELAETARPMAEELRKLRNELDASSHVRFEQVDPGTMALSMNQWMASVLATQRKVASVYESKYKSDILALRDEMCARLGNSRTSGLCDLSKQRQYEWTAHEATLTAVADNLEALASHLVNK